MAIIRFKRILPNLIRETEADECQGGGELQEIFNSYLVTPNPSIFVDDEKYSAYPVNYVPPGLTSMTPQPPV